MTKAKRLRGLIPLILSGVLELAGIAAIVWGITLISPIAGWIALGFALILFGFIIDPPNIPKFRRPPRAEVE